MKSLEGKEKLFRSSPLFYGMDSDEIKKCLGCSQAYLKNYKKEEVLFHEGDIPEYLFMLLDGAVTICRHSISGKRTVITTFHKRGELFGEVYLFLKETNYDSFAVATKDSQVLKIPKRFFYHTCGEMCSHHENLIKNMLAILAGKARFLNKRVQMMASGSLRQKVGKVLLENVQADGTGFLKMNREELADYLGATRPSISRELMKMREEGLIEVSGKWFRLLNLSEMEEYL
ncbi:Crp/Fnr family transcriptional regulator [Sinanaerobacter sp. ZZT-01]|uniref:Crp/Fnr family transcriptional regulator n=1 Tax=Sinanaerobacter sp. ZZT-01 TaxID=3111540 RepID=UPI002D78EA2A|nr:Crp/Fnr family transcriptional regulator [Sinanaerobacter sp. ZZT-01]WRR92384.1 Crp/Fnr family transcriptional regulator [Sinanaerobacter sp. ZZT-01]